MRVEERQRWPFELGDMFKQPLLGVLCQHVDKLSYEMLGRLKNCRQRTTCEDATVSRLKKSSRPGLNIDVD